MSRDMEKIGAYEARVHWSRLLDQVQAGSSYLISKRRQAVAAIVPLDQLSGAPGSSEEQELALLVEQFQRRHQETLDDLETAFRELETLRSTLAEARGAREELQRQDRPTDPGDTNAGRA